MPPVPFRHPDPGLMARFWLPSMPWFEFLGFALLIAVAVFQGQ